MKNTTCSAPLILVILKFVCLHVEPVYSYDYGMAVMMPYVSSGNEFHLHGFWYNYKVR